MSAIHYNLDDGFATIQIDDGKRNALSPEVLKDLYAAFDRAESDQAAVILTGRDDVFSAGFDLNVMKRGGSNAMRMLRLGYALPARLLAYPYPLVAACNGHSFAMGVFMMLSADYVIGSHGDFKIAANEVAIGLPMPRVAAAMLQHRMSPAAFQRAVVLSEYFDVDAAREVGLFDTTVDPSELTAHATACIRKFTELDMGAHKTSKRRIRKPLIRKIRRSVYLDLFDAAMLGLRGTKPRKS